MTEINHPNSDNESRAEESALNAIIDAAQAAAEAAEAAASAARKAANALRAILAAGSIQRTQLRSRTVRAPIADADLQIIIAAAITVALQGRSFRIRRIHLAERPSLVWGQLGRASIQSSHMLEKR